MRPILYQPEETAFQNNGIGIMSDAISCIATTSLNGKYEISMQYPLNGIHAANITMRNIIACDTDPVAACQPYRIYNINKSTPNYITVYARHVVYDLAGVPVVPFTATTAPAAMSGLESNAVTDCPFRFTTDKSTQAKFSVSVPSPIWSLLGGSEGSILDVYGGEYEYDKWSVKLHNRRGEDRGVSIRYGKNLTSLAQDENCANCYTGVMPYWVDRSTGAVTMIPDRVVHAEGNFGYTKILPVDFSAKFETVPTADQLISVAKSYIKSNAIGVPTVSWKVEFVQLEQTEEYRGKALLERVLLGDTVHVEFVDMGISVSSRVVEVEYDCILHRYKSVTLGSVKSNLAQTIVGQSQQIAQRPDKTEMKISINQLTGALLGALGGSVRLLDTNGDGMPDLIYIADDPDPARAVKVWRFNYEGWGASKNGYDGPYEMGASFDSGIIADFIRGGTIDATIVKVINLIADNITSGRLASSDGRTYFDLDNDEIVCQYGMGIKAVLNAGALGFFNGEGQKRIQIVDEQIQFFGKNEEEVIGGFDNLFPGEFRLTTYDADERKVMTHTLYWTTMDGVKVLAGQ